MMSSSSSVSAAGGRYRAHGAGHSWASPRRASHIGPGGCERPFQAGSVGIDHLEQSRFPEPSQAIPHLAAVEVRSPPGVQQGLSRPALARRRLGRLEHQAEPRVFLGQADGQEQCQGRMVQVARLAQARRGRWPGVAASQASRAFCHQADDSTGLEALQAETGELFLIAGQEGELLQRRLARSVRDR